MSSKEKNLNRRRSLGVARAWKHEKGLVCQGRGTREWVLWEQKDMLDNGRVKGYQGHHMKSVARYPEYADDPNNIQFLCGTPENNEHLRAHGGDYRNETNSMYDVYTGRMIPLPAGRPRPLPVRLLREKAITKRGYTRYAEKGASHAPRRKKAQTQVTFEGRTYTRTMIQTGKSAQTGKKTPTDIKTKPQIKAAVSAGERNTTAKSAKRSASVTPKASAERNMPVAPKVPAVRSVPAAPKKSAARTNTAGTGGTPRESGSMRGSVRQMIREMQKRSEKKK